MAHRAPFSIISPNNIGVLRQRSASKIAGGFVMPRYFSTQLVGSTEAGFNSTTPSRARAIAVVPEQLAEDLQERLRAEKRMKKEAANKALEETFSAMEERFESLGLFGA
jgi:hypothetical protein